ncbi:MAG: DnaJ family molecular chaperone [Ahrensia sp.]
MTIWTRIADFVFDTAGGALATIIEQVRTVFEGDPETRSRVAFSVAMIALSAKMAKADGVVTADEVDAFRDIFEIPAQEAHRVSSLYNLAKQDTAGFEAYAAQMARLCGNDGHDCPALYDILDGLFHIAKADGVVHDKEIAFLRRVAEIFQLTPRAFESVLARHVSTPDQDPWSILGIDRDADFETARRAYRQLAREHHPDALAARGIPEEFRRIGNDRIAAINAAWEIVRESYKRA